MCIISGSMNLARASLAPFNLGDALVIRSPDTRDTTIRSTDTDKQLSSFLEEFSWNFEFARYRLSREKSV
jgi:hypothetical protein